MRVVVENDLQAIKERAKVQVRRMIQAGQSVATMDILKFAFMFGLDPRDAPGILFDILRELQNEENPEG